jgi:A/G-specific adenine glycosylase
VGRKRASERELVDALLAWFAGSARQLPWRAAAAKTRRDPYHVLVSETMLQQTQVSRVHEKFPAFVARFPRVADLAAASEDAVLAAWTGLGYYRRARMLHAAAKAIAAEHGGIVPRDVAVLRALPGVGAYTAGAIASIAFGETEAAVDTNVARVLLRVRGKEIGPERERTAWAWEQARAIATAATPRTGDCNEAMMELGALVCRARGPLCGVCPWAKVCVARATDATERIPPPKQSAARKAITHVVFAAAGDAELVPLQQRGAAGLWARLWQQPTLELESDDAPTTARQTMRLARAQGLEVEGLSGKPAMDFVFATTHRSVRHVVFIAASVRGAGVEQVPREQALQRGMASPQRRVLRELPGSLFA